MRTPAAPAKTPNGVKLADVAKPDPTNPNKHTERGGGMMEDSLRSCGFGDSLTVDRNGLTISGNQRLEKLVELGFDDPLIVETDGKRPVIHKRTDLDLLKDPRARMLSIFQNRVGEVNLDWDDAVLRDLGREQLGKFWSDDEMAKLLGTEIGSDGKLLDLTQVTIEDPKHTVEQGDRWKVGKHILYCEDVLTGWEAWKKDLDGAGVIFAPYPGPYVLLTVKADKATKVVLVQPDPYICGHILDRWSEIKGEESIVKS